MTTVTFDLDPICCTTASRRDNSGLQQPVRRHSRCLTLLLLVLVVFAITISSDSFFESQDKVLEKGGGVVTKKQHFNFSHSPHNPTDSCG